jgi:hypothetical protein
MAQRTRPSERGAVTAADSLFETLLGELEPAQRERFLRTLRQVRLDADDDDPIWRLFVALHWHLKRYEDIPRQIRQTTLDTLQATTATLAAAAREQTIAVVAPALAAASQDLITTTVRQTRARTLAGALGIALVVVAGAVGIGWWSGRAQLAQAVAATQTELPALAAWAQDFDTAEKRQRAAWALSADGAWVYALAQWNNGFHRWRACEFGQGVGYTQREGSYTICYPASPKSHTSVAGLAIAREGGKRP